MISNERPSPFKRRPYVSGNTAASPYYPHFNKPPVHEDTLKTAEVQVERKVFLFTLKENVRGRLLRITEDCGGRHNSIIIPATGLVEFKKLLEEMVNAAAEIKPPGHDAHPGGGAEEVSLP